MLRTSLGDLNLEADVIMNVSADVKVIYAGFKLSTNNSNPVTKPEWNFTSPVLSEVAM